ncbi:MAG: DoxX family protein [Gammaproteobacteria bacterium]
MLSWVPLRPPHARHILRVAIAIVFLSHGLTRAYMDRVVPFGVFLDAQGFPYGIAWAWGVTLLEIVGGVLLLANTCVRPLAILYTVQMLFGIWLVHLANGWFVVGHGRDGVEYSFLIIAACVALFASANTEGR